MSIPSLRHESVSAIDRALGCPSRADLTAHDAMELDKFEAFLRLLRSEQGLRFMLGSPSWLAYLGLSDDDARALLAKLDRGDPCAL